MVGIEEIQLL